MKRFYLFQISIFFLFFFIPKFNFANTLTPYEVLARVLPEDIALRQKLSLKENISTVFSELETFIQNTMPLPDSNNLTPGWTAHNDELLINALLEFKDQFLADSSEIIESYFKNRMKKTLNEHPNELWEYYFSISKLFPQKLFWLSFYEAEMNQIQIKWAELPNQDWISNTLIPLLLKDKSTSAHWTKDFLANLIGLINVKTSSFVLNSENKSLNFKNSSISDSQQLMSLLEKIDPIFEYIDPRLQTLSNDDLFDLEKKYLEVIQELSNHLIVTNFLIYLNYHLNYLIFFHYYHTHVIYCVLHLSD